MASDSDLVDDLDDLLSRSIRPGSGLRVPEIVTASEVRPESVRWWWRGRLAMGKLTVLEGEPDLGKSSILIDLGARVSTGRPMPDGTPAPEGPGDVLMLAAAEGGLADTIIPRLTAAGADLDRVHVWRGTPGLDGFLRGFELAQDLAELEEAIVSRGVRLVVVDALMAAMPGGSGSNRDPDVRRLLHPLAEIAERTGAMVVVNRHHRKGAGKAIERGGGSIAIGAVARAVLAVVRDDTDETGERRLLGVVKANLLPEADKSSTAYRLVGATIEGPAGEVIDTSRVEWLGQDERRIRDLLARTDDEAGSGEAGECAKAIRALLDDGPMRGAEVEADLLGQGFSKATIRRARERIGITREAGAMFNEGYGGPWSWRLPDSDEHKRRSCSPQRPEDQHHPHEQLRGHADGMRTLDLSAAPGHDVVVHADCMSNYSIPIAEDGLEEVLGRTGDVVIGVECGRPARLT